jgi:hypothetical protein
MSEQAVADAIKAALPAVTLLEAYPPNAHPGSDIALVSRQTDVGVQDEAAFRHFVETLCAEPDLQSLQGKLFAASLGFFTGPIHIERLAKSMLAQILNGRDTHELLRSLSQFLRHNSSEALIIIAVSGVDVVERFELGDGVELTPIKALPPSVPRGVALGQDPRGNLTIIPYLPPMQAALTQRITVSPIIVTEQQQVESRDRHVTILHQTLECITETMNCLGLLDLQPVVSRIGWHHFLDPGAFFIGPASGWSSWDIQTLTWSRQLEIVRAKELFAAYFEIPKDLRESVLRVPLDRLNRALRPASTLVDKAIDLGIALEALLLHEINDNRELRFRFSLRGAQLLGGDLDTRRAQLKLLRDVYDLRSAAVHNGRLKETERNTATLSQALQVCARLIRLAIDRGARIDFDALELGAPLG